MVKILDLPNKILNYHRSLYTKLNEAQRFINLILPFIRPFLLSTFFTYVVMLAEDGVSLLMPRYTGGIIDIITKSKDESDLQELVTKMFILSLVSQQLFRFSEEVKRRVLRSVDMTLKTETYRILLECDMEYFDKKSSTELMQILNNGIHGLVKMCIKQSKTTLKTINSSIVSLYMMYTISPKLMIIALVIMLIRMSIPYLERTKKTELHKALNKAYNSLSRLRRQAIENILLVKCFSTEKKEYNDFIDTQNEVDKIESNIAAGNGWIIEMVTEIVYQGLDLCLVWCAGVMVFDETITVGGLSTFNMYATTFKHATSNLTRFFKGHQITNVHMDNLMEFVQLLLKKEAKKSRAITKPQLKGNIEISQVSFSYVTKPGVQVLSDVSLKINTGESVAIVGASGSGKTTLSYLLLGLYAPTKGTIYIDGEDIQDYDPTWLRHNIGYVSQEPVLLDKTVKKNLVYGLEDTYTREQIEEALKLSHAQFILNKTKFPKGLASRNSSKLSGGQKQRIAIARAFIKDPRILILDEPTSALDGESESKVQKAIDDLVALGDRTVIVIAHRLSTIINCHRIVVVDEGKIVEQGTHKELIERNGAYKKLFEFQIDNMKGL